MGIRLTEISTPLGGIGWEYANKTEKKEILPLRTLQPRQIIKVFISSICGDKGKYDRIRAELKKAIEDQLRIQALLKSTFLKLKVLLQYRQAHIIVIIWRTAIPAFS